MDSLTQNSGTNRAHSTPTALSFFLGVAAGLIGFAVEAFAMPVNVSPQNLASCDPLGLAATTATGTTLVDELGTAGFPADETILATSGLGQEIACPSNYTIDPDLAPAQVNVKIVNTTGVDFSNLWYVADPETSILNIDGLVNEQAAFKIDSTGINRPLIFESFTTGIAGVFEDGEIWVFAIDAYLNTSGTAPEILTSVGLVGNLSGNASGVITKSSGSIIGTPVPEPGTALLMSLGLMGLSVAGRERRKVRLGRTSRRRRKRRAFLVGPISTLSASALMLAALSAPAAAQVPLIGNGPNLAVPSPNPDPFWTNNMWTSVRIPDPGNPGTNSSGAPLTLVFDPPSLMQLQAPWQGNFQHTIGTGLSSSDTGLNTFNFGGLAGDLADPGTLAVNSLFTMGDLDAGSGLEELRLIARDSNLSVITEPWLSEPIFASGVGLANPGAYPGWIWDGSSYYFDSSNNYGGNPSLAIRFTTLVAIHELDINKFTAPYYSVSFGAQIEPIPEPSTALLVGLGLAVLTHRKARTRERVS